MSSSEINTTMVFNSLGLGCSLKQLECTANVGISIDWQTHGKIQRQLLSWYNRTRYSIDNVEDISSTTSNDCAVLNAFFRQHGLRPLFTPFGPDEFGIASIVDLMFGWRRQGEPGYITGRQTGQQHRAFTLRGKSVEAYKSSARGASGPLINLRATNNVSLWAIKARRPANEISMLDMAVQLVKNRVYVPNVRIIHMPTIEIDCANRLQWLPGLNIGNLKISQAAQHVKARINELGGRMISETAVAATRSSANYDEVTFDEPFLLWATQERGDFDLPIMICYVTPDSWKAPQGSLEDLSK